MMKEILISKDRLKELELIESKMSALEVAGVDNWEGYSIALEEINKQEEINNAIDLAVERAVEIIHEGAFEPSERGAGWCANEDSLGRASNVLKDLIISLKQF